ncbi:hypothetical protein HGRIS_010746 [Hohenbuehelia grisea]|uniref:Uncharacterized protein n=1 Tax=Hohenbuehelia grisea TaxID=104357 RepID=A0ABR3IY04_9AGAR
MASSVNSSNTSTSTASVPSFLGLSRLSSKLTSIGDWFTLLQDHLALLRTFGDSLLNGLLIQLDFLVGIELRCRVALIITVSLSLGCI